MLGVWIKKIKSYLEDNPNVKKFLGLYIVLLAIPLTVLLALRAQNILQHAGGEQGTVQIVDQNSNVITRTSDPNVYLLIKLPQDWTTISAKESNISLAPKAFAQTTCPTITCGTNSGAGGVCSFGTSPNSNVPGCTATCPDGRRVEGFSVSACQSNNCYFNDCTCYPNPGACDSSSTPTPAPITPAPVAPGCGPTSDGTWVYSCDCNTGLGVPGHHATRYCTNGGTWTDPTCYEGLYLCKGGTPIFTPEPQSSQPATPTPQHVLRSLYITNSDTDGSSGGSVALGVTQDFAQYLNKPIPWRLNSLLAGQTEASRIVQVNLYDGITLVPYVATVTLFRTNQGSGVLSRVEISFNKNSLCSTPPDIIKGQECGISALAYDTTDYPIFDGISYAWGISSPNSIGTLSKTEENITTFYATNFGSGTIWVIAKQTNQPYAQKSVEIFVVDEKHRKVAGAKTVNADINRDGKVDQKDIDILLSEFGRKGPNLPADLNRDGTIDGRDYQILKSQVISH